MATSLLALLDDIATMLDDVAAMTKVATQKTAGVLGDGLALNAQQVAGVPSRRELPVVFAVARGSAKNKLILVPAALVISALVPFLVTPLLMLGGAYLCFEGFEKVFHKFFHAPEDKDHQERIHQAMADAQADLGALEKERIAGAVRTDFILSAEIIVISLGTVTEASFVQQVAVLSAIAVIMTVGVYGLVAAIVKLDDLGAFLSRRGDAVSRAVGRSLLLGAPYLMRGLGIAGTAAMFLVGGGILSHGIPVIHHLSEQLHHLGGIVGTVGPLLLDGVTGILSGGLILGIVRIVQRTRGKPTTT